MTQAVEETLAPLVYSQIQDQIPELYDYLTGFQEVAEEDNGNKVLGILAFNVHGKHYYMLVFYINGFLKPLILLFDYDKKKFLPATKKVLSHITKPKPGVEGKLQNKDQFRQSLSIPNLYQFSLPPVLFGKIGHVKNIAKQIIKSAINYEKKAQFNSALANTEFWQLLRDNQFLLRKVASNYDIKIDPPKKYWEEKTTPELTIKVEVSSKNTPEENLSIQRDGMIVDDKRKEHTKIEPKYIENGQIWGPPLINGLYYVFGTGVEKKWVFTNPINEGASQKAMVYDSGELTEIPISNILTRVISTDLSQLRDEMVSMNSMKSDTDYLLFSNNLKYFSGPISFSKKEGINWKGIPANVMINPHKTNLMKLLKDTLVISEDTLALPIKLTNTFIPGTLTEWMNTLKNKEIDIQKSGFLYKISLDKKVLYEGPKLSSKIYLISKAGFCKEDAESALNMGGKFLIKKAQVYPEPFYQVTTQTMPKVPNNNSIEPILNPYVNPNYRSAPSVAVSEEMQRAIQIASNTKNSKVLDTTLLELLATKSNNLERIKEIIPILSDAIHAMGSMLFDVWWNSKSYGEDFTIDEAFTLEQQILSTFKDLGDITLDLVLRKKIYGVI